MKIRLIGWVSALSGVAALLVALPVVAQTDAPHEVAAPDYGSDSTSGVMSNDNFNTPESDGRPGVKFYKEGMAAYHHKDYEHAVYMLKVAASWAYKPAAYNLGVMYFQGEGVPVDKPRGTAWMFLAAERNSPAYVSARHMMVSSLDVAQLARANELLQVLEPKYGDKVAMRKAKARWAFVKGQKTGTRVGGTVGNLQVGITGAGANSMPMGTSASGAAMSRTLSTSMQVLSGGSIDGSVAYQQFAHSDNPYDPVFLKHRSGIVIVEPLQRVDAKPTGEKPASSQAAGSPQSH